MEGLRLDKWLWAARFFKTRTLATRAVEGGHVKVNGERCKPARDVRVGDRLAVQAGEVVWDIRVLGLSDRRGPASQARLLYEESESGRQLREARQAERRVQADPSGALKGRPTKRDRRLIHRFTEDR